MSRSQNWVCLNYQFVVKKKERGVFFEKNVCERQGTLSWQNMLKGKINDVKNEGRKPNEYSFLGKRNEKIFLFMLVDHNGTMYVKVLAAS